MLSSKRVLGTTTGLSALAKADAILQTLVTDKRVPGLAIVVHKNGKPILEKGYGFAHLEKEEQVNPKSTVFRIASVSKPLAAAALAHAVHQGSIVLDSSFYTYVPYYPKKKWDFTIRQLAAHTAGIRAYRGKEFALNQPYAIKDSIDFFKNDPLLFEPGTNYAYTSLDWVLISLAIEEAVGIPFQDYVRRVVFNPLGMSNTYAPPQFFDVVDADVEREELLHSADEASYYTKSSGRFRAALPVNNFYKLAGGGFLSTAKDIALFGQAVLEGNVFGDITRSEFLTTVSIKDKPTYYGLGWQVSEDKLGRPFLGHVGSSVGAYSNFIIYPEQHMVITILINCTDPKVQDELDAAVSCLIDVVEV